MNQEIAKEILNQLGGNRFLVMTGAKKLVSTPTGLYFRLPRAKDGINTVHIDLAADDTYTVSFERVTCGKEYKRKVIKTEKYIYNDMLQDIFTENTGLYTRL